MDLSLSPHAASLLDRLRSFMSSHVYPAEPLARSTVIESLKTQARSLGLWNLFLPAVSGLTNVEYARLAEVSGRSPYLAPEAMNCSAPDTGNMELLHLFGTDAQRRQWLEPLLDGRIRSGFCMTEPDVASSDARNIATSIVRDGDEYVIDGHKWWTTGAGDPRCELFIVMGRHSMVLVPPGTPGVHIVRSLPVFGYHDHQGHCEIRFTGVRVPVANLLGKEGDAFAMAQARLGPGRVHHAMRLLGMAERALELMCRRALSRVAFGGPLADQGVVRAQIAESRMEIEQARLLVLRTAWLIDQSGARSARAEIAAIKVVAPRVAEAVLSRAIQIHGGAGVSDDLPLARMWASARAIRIADGPDEVHVRTVARHELSRYR